MGDLIEATQNINANFDCKVGAATQSLDWSFLLEPYACGIESTSYQDGIDYLGWHVALWHTKPFSFTTSDSTYELNSSGILSLEDYQKHFRLCMYKTLHAYKCRHVCFVHTSTSDSFLLVPGHIILSAPAMECRSILAVYDISSLIPRLSWNVNMYCTESLVSFLCKHDVIKIGPKQKGNVLRVVQPTMLQRSVRMLFNAR